jgi:ABC-type multidrug transport system fused ATPase/permease subunit
MSFLHHQLFFEGMIMGFNTRQSLIAAIHQKIFKLNSATITQISNGHVVNLVSNDLRRLDDFWPFWSFIWAGPLELSMVLLMVSLELGFVPALLGSLTMISMIPLQAILTRPVAKIRLATAKKTDERVRVTSEVINGALAVKMLAWESPVADKINAIRDQEAKHLKRMSNIRGANNALTFCCVPATAFVTFASAAAFNGSINIPSVFYCLSLLALPRLYMVQFFVMAISSLSELQVSIKRINHFLSLPEPPQPQSQHDDSKETMPKGFVVFRGASFDWATPLGSLTSKSADKGETDDLVHLLHPVPTPSLPSSHTLESIQVEIKPGELIGITGAVGAGKSSLLQVLLGELLSLSDDNQDKSPILTGTSAYCAQVPWIQSGTVRDNICFGLPFEEERYQSILRSCSLEDDIASLPAQDKTEIGERGVNLSGGQKARLSLARCAYFNADVQLLDDPLSAVDPRVARVLFDEAINGVMGKSTRLLVTHQRQFLPSCDKCLVLREGKVVAFGSWEEVAALDLKELEGVKRNMEVSHSFDDLAAQDETEVGADEPAVVNGSHKPEGKEEKTGDISTIDAEVKGIIEVPVEEVKPADPEELPLIWPHEEEPKPTLKLQTQSSMFRLPSFMKPGPRSGLMMRGKSFGPGLNRLFSLSPSSPTNGNATKMQRGNSIRMSANNESKESGRLVEKETRSTGSVPFSVYTQYFRALGLSVLAFMTCAFLSGQAVFLASDLWLAKWASQSGHGGGKDKIWLTVYGSLVAGIITLSFLRALLFFNVTITASSDIHKKMTKSVLCAPLGFFHTNPTGRILNRFSKDISSQDDLLPPTAFDVFQTGFQVLNSLILVSWAVPFILPFFLPLAALFWLVRARYITASREVKRWEATTKSPIFEKFSASLRGLTTIRAFNSQGRFHDAFLQSLDDNGEW